jgi:asparagine synthase (glutamine-hydrolysing)
MCGIAGIISNNKSKLLEISTLLKYLQNRGPESTDILSISDKLILGHTRLSIIDIDNRSNQPMMTRSKKNVIVFNGEIYNYKDLKKSFFKDFVFKTNSDTEVLIEGIEKYGFDFLNKVRGFYSFVVYNYEHNKIFLAKDLFGKKPLFYHKNNSEFYFSSELHGLNKIIKKNNKHINHFGLTHYLWKGYFHEENTIYKDIKSVVPGEILEFHLNENNLKNISRNDKLKFKFNNENIKREKNIEELLNQSIDYRKVSDVDISYLLSGGIDSSLICKFASNNEKINTYYAKNQKDENIFDDMSTEVSKSINSNHNLLEINDLKLDDILQKNFEMFNEPFADYSSIPSYLIYNKISEKTKVAISGDGADEIFGGYQDYRIFVLKSFINKLPSTSNLALSYKILNQFKFLPKKILYLFFSFYLNEENLYHLLSNGGWNLYYRKNYMKNNMFNEYFNENLEESVSKKYLNSGNSCLERGFNSYLERLKYDFLVKVDRASMLNSLEIRCPFLDLELFNKMKFSNPFSMVSLFKTKKELKNILKKHELGYLNKHKKRGFSIPLEKYLIEKRSIDILQSLIDPNSIICDYFDRDKISDMIANKKNIKDNFYRLWILLVFNYWHLQTK